MTKSGKVIIFGNTAFAEIAYEYFTHDSPLEVVAFCVDRGYLKETELHGLPVVPFDALILRFAPEDHLFFAAVTYQRLNRFRADILGRAKAMGFRSASYVSSRAFVWRNVVLGEHCFIFENNVVQPFVTLGDNVILWSGNHIGHHSVLGNNVFVSSHVVISGYVTVGANCFLGVNSAIAQNTDVGPDCWINPGVSVARSLSAGTLLKTPKPEAATATSYQFFKVPPPIEGT